jgi:hypothetical protein
MGSARRGWIPLLEANEALALHHFHLFVLMHILGDNSDSFGDDNDDHQHSLIGGVPRPNVADVINWRPLEAQEPEATQSSDCQTELGANLY